MNGSSLKQVQRRTGLTRMQLRYLEKRGALGFVARSGGRTLYGADQVELLERISRLRALGCDIDEATALGHELGGAYPTVATARLDALLAQALADVARNSRAALDLATLRSDRAARAG